MYGHRARIGYACPPRVAEVFIYEFYKIAPKGVTLAISTVGGGRANQAELRDGFRLSMEAAEELAKTGVDVVVLGGEPLNASVGDELDDHLAVLSQKFGIPVTTSLTAQDLAVQAVGARKAAVLSYGGGYGTEDLLPKGVQLVASKNAGIKGGQLAKIPIDVPVRLAREVKREHPEIDTIKIRTAHWATVEAIDGLEKELDVNVVAPARPSPGTACAPPRLRTRSKAAAGCSESTKRQPPGLREPQATSPLGGGVP